jgi:hypothetical protein
MGKRKRSKTWAAKILDRPVNKKEAARNEEMRRQYKKWLDSRKEPQISQVLRAALKKKEESS